MKLKQQRSFEIISSASVVQKNTLILPVEKNELAIFQNRLFVAFADWAWKSFCDSVRTPHDLFTVHRTGFYFRIMFWYNGKFGMELFTHQLRGACLFLSFYTHARAMFFVAPTYFPTLK